MAESLPPPAFLVHWTAEVLAEKMGVGMDGIAEGLGRVYCTGGALIEKMRLGMVTQGQERRVLLGASSLATLAAAGLCATLWSRGHYDEHVQDGQVDEVRARLGAPTVTQLSAALQPAHSPPELCAEEAPQLELENPGPPVADPDTAHVAQLDQTQESGLQTPPDSPRVLTPQSTPGSVDRWKDEVSQAMAAEAAADAFLSQSEVETPRLTVERPAHIVEADDKVRASVSVCVRACACVRACVCAHFSVSH